MQLFKNTPNIDFLKFRQISILLSLAIIIAGGFSFFTKGMNLGIDFLGGVNIQVQFSEEVDIRQVRDRLDDNLGSDAVITHFGNKQNNEFLIAIPQKLQLQLNQDLGSLVKESLEPEFSVTIRKLDLVGPKIGSELREKAIYAILLSLVGILFYVTIRFEFIFGVGAILALFHDILIIVAIFLLLGKEFNLIIIASLLTIVGYSLNDTIVIFDRIREKRKQVDRDLKELINLAINECLSRTILTSVTTILVVLALYFFGGEILSDFALSIIIGLITGTYSSVFVAGSTIFYFSKKDKKEKTE